MNYLTDYCGKENEPKLKMKKNNAALNVFSETEPRHKPRENENVSRSKNWKARNKKWNSRISSCCSDSRRWRRKTTA